MSSLYVTRIEASTTLDYGYDTYLVDASTNDITLTLPATGDGSNFIISRIDNSTNQVLIAPDTGSNLNGSATAKELNAFENVRLVYTNGEWFTCQGKWLV